MTAAVLIQIALLTGRPTGRPGGSTGTSRARRRVSREGTPRRARVPPVDYRDGLSRAVAGAAYRRA